MDIQYDKVDKDSFRKTEGPTEDSIQGTDPENQFIDFIKGAERNKEK